MLLNCMCVCYSAASVLLLVVRADPDRTEQKREVGRGDRAANSSACVCWREAAPARRRMAFQSHLAVRVRVRVRGRARG